MSNEDLVAYVIKCANENIDTSINISNIKILKLIMSLLINKSNKQVDAFIVFSEKHDLNQLFECFNDDIFIRNTIDFLEVEDARFNILSNNAKALKETKLFKSITAKGLKGLKVKNVPKATFDAVASNFRMSFLIGDDESVLIGEFDDLENMEQPRLANFGDTQFYKNLKGYITSVNDVILAGGLKND